MTDTLTRIADTQGATALTSDATGVAACDGLAATGSATPCDRTRQGSRP